MCRISLFFPSFAITFSPLPVIGSFNRPPKRPSSRIYLFLSFHLFVLFLVLPKVISWLLRLLWFFLIFIIRTFIFIYQKKVHKSEITDLEVTSQIGAFNDGDDNGEIKKVLNKNLETENQWKSSILHLYSQICKISLHFWRRICSFLTQNTSERQLKIS